MNWNEDLEGREFYEVCQMYRHAKDWKGKPTDGWTPSAGEAFELLKAWIRGDDRHFFLQALKVYRDPDTEPVQKPLAELHDLWQDTRA